MDCSSIVIEAELRVKEEMAGYHRARLLHYDSQILHLTHELNRARRLEREAKELQE